MLTPIVPPSAASEACSIQPNLDNVGLSLHVSWLVERSVKVRYRYYVSRDLHHSGDARSAEGWRLPAREIEPLVQRKIVALLNDPIDLLAQTAVHARCRACPLGPSARMTRRSFFVFEPR